MNKFLPVLLSLIGFSAFAQNPRYVPGPWSVSSTGGGGIPIAGTGINVTTNGNNTYTIAATGSTAATNIYRISTTDSSITIVTNDVNFLYTITVGPLLNNTAVSNAPFVLSTNFIGNAGNLTNLNLPFVTVSSKGVANSLSTVPNNGADFGPDTPGTTTYGINEAIASLPRTNGVGPISGGGKVVLEAGVYVCSGQILIPNDYPYNLTLEGAGQVNTLLKYTGTTNFVQTAPNTATTWAVGNLVMRGIGFAYLNDTNLAHLVLLDYMNEVAIYNCLFTTWQAISLKDIGSSMLYISGVPTNAVGTVGLRVKRSSYGNKVLVSKSAFYGLAAGCVMEQDHAEIEYCIFANIGHHWSYGELANTIAAPVRATAWPKVVGGTDVTNLFAYGPGLVAAKGFFRQSSIENQWFHNQTCIAYMNDVGFGPLLYAFNSSVETCDRWLLVWESEFGDKFLNLMEFDAMPFIKGTNSMLQFSSGNPVSLDLSGENYGRSLWNRGDKYLWQIGATTNFIINTSGINWYGTAYGNGAGISNIVSATYVTTATLTNKIYDYNISYATNLQSGAVLDLSKPYQLLSISGNTTLTGVSGKSNTEVKHSVLMVTNATANVYSLAVPASWRTSDGARTYYVTNGQMAILSVNCYANSFTNAVCVNLW